MQQDKVSGSIAFFLGLIVLSLSTMGMIKVIQFLLRGLSVRIVQSVTRCNGYFGILFGGAVTVLVQSSQVVTSVLVPFGGVGALPLESIYPIVIGANIGTALQTVLTAMNTLGTAPLQVALAHLFFNVTGFLLWYPLPHLRVVPLYASRRLGHGATIWRLFPLATIVLMYLLMPMFFFGLSELYLTGSNTAQAFSILLAVATGLGLAWLLYWCKYKGGDQKYVDFVTKLGMKPDAPRDADTNNEDEDVLDETRAAVSKSKSEDMQRLQNLIRALSVQDLESSTTPFVHQIVNEHAEQQKLRYYERVEC